MDTDLISGKKVKCFLTITFILSFSLNVFFDFLFTFEYVLFTFPSSARSGNIMAKEVSLQAKPQREQ